MRRIKGTFLALGALALLTTACTAEPAPAATPGDTEAACTCDQAKEVESMWCARCSHGFVAGDMVTNCRDCFAEKTGGVACATHAE